MKKVISIALIIVFALSSLVVSASAATTTTTEITIADVSVRGVVPVIHGTGINMYCTQMDVAHPEKGCVYQKVTDDSLNQNEELKALCVAISLNAPQTIDEQYARSVMIWERIEHKTLTQYVFVSAREAKPYYEFINELANRVNTRDYVVEFELWECEGYQTLMTFTVTEAVKGTEPEPTEPTTQTPPPETTLPDVSGDEPEDPTEPEDTTAPEDTTVPEIPTEPEDTTVPEDTTIPEIPTEPEDTTVPEDTTTVTEDPVPLGDEVVYNDYPEVPQTGVETPFFLIAIVCFIILIVINKKKRVK